MHILIVSHSCATALNQEIYARIQRETGWKITLVVPDRWHDEFGNALRQPPCEGLENSVIRCAVWKQRQHHLPRLSHALAALPQASCPDVIYMNHEPYALSPPRRSATRTTTPSACPSASIPARTSHKKYPKPPSPGWSRWCIARRASRCRSPTVWRM
jgi:hypothetical protein